MERTRKLVLAFLGVGVSIGILALAGCFDSKIDRFRAAVILKTTEGAGTWKEVTCRPWHGTDDYWDYSCRVESTRAKPFSFEIKVNGSRITDQSGP
jgi:hypothetical protein